MEDPTKPANHSDVAAAFAAGAAALTASNRILPITFPVGMVPVTIDHNGQAYLRDEWMRKTAALAPAPPCRRGTTVLYDLPSFMAHVRRHSPGDTTVIYLDTEEERITAIYNGTDSEGGCGWGDDRAVIEIKASPEWREWESRSGAMMGQYELAEWIEEHLEEIAPPEEGSDHAKPLDLLAMAKDLQIHTKGTFARKVDPRTGTGSLTYATEHGEGSTRIPRAFGVALRPWEGADAFRIEARLRFSLEGGKAAFSFKLHRLEEVWRAAWRKLAEQLARDTAVVVPSYIRSGEGDATDVTVPERRIVHPVYLGSAPAVVTVR
jgi:uncharacterized protein YfdQ (DUF2303 family)